MVDRQLAMKASRIRRISRNTNDNDVWNIKVSVSCYYSLYMIIQSVYLIFWQGGVRRPMQLIKNLSLYSKYFQQRVSIIRKTLIYESRKVRSVRPWKYTNFLQESNFGSARKRIFLYTLYFFIGNALWYHCVFIIVIVAV